MALTCGFYNSVDGDRKYDATQFASLFDGVITDGVVAAVGDFFATTPGGGMVVNVGSGRAWFNRTWTYSDAAIPLTLDASDLLYDRIDTVVLEIDTSVMVRDNSIKVLKGIPAQNPQMPSLTNTGDIHQYALAYVRVKASAVEVGAGDITINVGQPSCPFVTSIVETPELDVLFAQWDAQFTSWFENVQSQLEGDVAANLQRQIDLKANKTDIGDFTTPAKKLGLIENITVGASLSVLADIGDLNVWRRTVEISEGEPASYTLGPKTDRIIFSGGYNANGRGRADYGTAIKVYDNGDIALSGTTGYVAEGFVVLSNFNVIKGKYVRFSEYNSESALSSDCVNKIFYIPSSASFTYIDGSADRTEQNYGMRITDTQLVTGVPAVLPGTYVDFPVSVNPNAYQTGSDAKPAGYTLGEVQNGEYQLTQNSPSGDVTWKYADSIGVLNDGTIYMENPSEVGVSTSGTPLSFLQEAFIGKYVSLESYPNQNYTPPFPIGVIYYIPETAEIQSKNTYYIFNQYQTVTGYPAITAGTAIEYLGQLGDKDRMRIMSYVGTGTYGKSTPCSITADFPIKLALYVLRMFNNNEYFIISMISSELSTEWAIDQGFGLSRKNSSALNGDSYGKKSEDGKTFYWYFYPRGDSARDSHNQLNRIGATYYFLVFG